MPKQRKVGNRKKYSKEETLGKHKSPCPIVVKQERPDEMKQTGNFVFFFAAIALVFGVCVTPLTADMTSCK